MKVIDLLNKIANGEIPKKIKKKDIVYVADDSCYFSNMYVEENDTSHRLLLDFIPDLNNEIEIIEEDKKIEKMIPLNNVSGASDLVAISQMQWENNLRIERKINEIIDYLEENK